MAKLTPVIGCRAEAALVVVVVVPLARSTLTLLVVWLAVTKSLTPSPFKSAATTDVRPVSGAKGLLGLERPVAVAEEDARGVAVAVRGNQVTLAVAVEVAHSNRHGHVSGAEGLLGLKRPVAVAQQHARGAVVRRSWQPGHSCRRR